MNDIHFCVNGLAAFGPGFSTIEELAAYMQDKNLSNEATTTKPAAEILPATERRRAPLPVKLAIEASTAACRHASVGPSAIKSIFSCGLGDTELTDYMCKVLASDNPALSPTKFHNSVHNAAAGYWTISTNCTLASNSIASHQESASIGLLESAIQATQEDSLVMLTCYDAPASKVLLPLLNNEHSFSAAFVIAPKNQAGEHATHLSMRVENSACEWPHADWGDLLNRCYGNNPSAKILAFIALLVGSAASLRLPLSQQTSLVLERA